MDKLSALGFTVVAGKIDRNGKNYGVAGKDGPVLTAEGDALVKALSPVTPKPRKKAEPAAVVPAEQTFDPEFE